MTCDVERKWLVLVIDFMDVQTVEASKNITKQQPSENIYLKFSNIKNSNWFEVD